MCYTKLFRKYLFYAPELFPDLGANIWEIGPMMFKFDIQAHMSGTLSLSTIRHLKTYPHVTYGIDGV